MLTDTEMLDYQIDTYKKESQLLKRDHEWGEWNNWREFTHLDMQIIDLEIERLVKEKEHLQQALKDYQDY